MTPAQIAVLSAVADAGPDGLRPYGPQWRPLKALRALGLVAAADGWPLRYQLTDAGRAALG